METSTKKQKIPTDEESDEPSDKSETEDVTVPTDDAASDSQETQSSGNEEVEANHQNITRRGRVVRKPNRFGYSL